MSATLKAKTQAHYDSYPFIEGGEKRIDWWRKYLRDFLPDEELHDRLVIDVGSSLGEISRGLIDRGARMVCLDLSLNSLRRCRQVNTEAEIIHGSALELPFPDQSFDHAISIGVLHHTPDCRQGFKELARVTAPGGTIVVFLYNYWNIYNLIYHAFRPIRATLPLNRIPRMGLLMLQPFVKSHLGQTLNEDQLRNLLGDKLWTPQATFHSVSEVRTWGIEEGLRLTATKRFFLGYANVMRFVKQGQPDKSHRRLLALKCLKCGEFPMSSAGSVYACDNCGNTYEVDDGIVRSTV
jgi:SAM-dependent methyltransferase